MGRLLLLALASVIYNSRMYIKILFFLYIISLFIFTLYAGLNYYRIQGKGWIHPQVLIFLFPFVLNFILAKFVFVQVNPLLTTLSPCIMIYVLSQKLKKLRIFGLTGGICCGKSTLVKMMSENIGNQLAIIDCDVINTQLREKGRAGYKLILSLLQKHGEDVSAYVNDYSKEIKREALSKYSFEHPKFLKELGAGLGRHILWEIVKQIFSNYAAKKKLILIDAPTLFETKILAHICFPIIVVGIDEAVQVERLVKTRNMTEDEAKLRIGSQMPLSLKKKLADVYVDNNGTPEEMFGKTLKFVNKILQASRK